MTLWPTNKPVRRLPWLAAAAVCALYALHWPHLVADFPNHTSFLDWAKYTDEGWYGKAAIQSVLHGSWYVPGDFNTAIALPVWPAMLWVVFKFAGVSVLAARALALLVFGGDLLLSYGLLRAAGAGRAATTCGMILLAANAYMWAFSRLAILESLLMFWVLAGWLLAIRLRPWTGGRRLAGLLGVGLLLTLAVLTKTTAVFLFPAAAVLLAWSAEWRPRKLCADFAAVTLGGVVPWLAYYLLVVRRYAVDYHYFFSANYWEHPKGLKNNLLAYWWAAHGTLWVGPWLVCAMLAALAAAAALSPGLRRAPLLYASLLAAAGYIFFTGWHNSPQPRYYMVVLYPVIFIGVLAGEALGRRSRPAAALAFAVFAAVGLRDLRQTLLWTAHPSYDFLRAARGLTAYIDTHSSGPDRLLLSISGDEITLFTHIPAICDDFGTSDLASRIQQYHPGWYAQWNELDPGTLEDIHDAGYRLQSVAHWHAFDDEDRDDLILYRMVPAAEDHPGQ